MIIWLLYFKRWPHNVANSGLNGVIGIIPLGHKNQMILCRLRILFLSILCSLLRLMDAGFESDRQNCAISCLQFQVRYIDADCLRVLFVDVFVSGGWPTCCSCSYDKLAIQNVV